MYHRECWLGLFQFLQHLLLRIFIRDSVRIWQLGDLNVWMVQQPAHKRLNTWKGKYTFNHSSSFTSGEMAAGDAQLVPGTPEALLVVPESDFKANSMFFRGKPISISWMTIGNGGTGEVFCFFCLGGRTCCMVTGVVASLELLSSNSGDDGWVDSKARYWHTARAAACVYGNSMGSNWIQNFKMNILTFGWWRKYVVTDLHFLPVENSFDWRWLGGSREQLLQQDQWRQRALGG